MSAALLAIGMLSFVSLLASLPVARQPLVIADGAGLGCLFA